MRELQSPERNANSALILHLVTVIVIYATIFSIFIELAGASLRSAPLVAWCKILLPISLYVVFGAGRTQFGILAGFRSGEFVPPGH